MKIEVKNYCSYDNLTFEFDNLGLTLITGDTGAGKSTLQDMIVWALFGRTAKGGSVDEVRNWNNLEEPTKAIATLDTITVTRIRGKASQNDLYWVENDQIHRGKDIAETQRLLEHRLGLNAEVFFTSNYFNEFSASSRFFVDTTKNRRALFEKLTDLSFPQELSSSLLERRKEVKTLLKTATIKVATEQGALSNAQTNLVSCKNLIKSWDESQKASILKLEEKFNNFEQDKANKIEQLQLKHEQFEVDRSKWIDDYEDKIVEEHKYLTDSSPPVSVLLEIKQEELEILQHAKHVCEVCGGDAHSKHRQELLNDIQKLQKIDFRNQRTLERIELFREEQQKTTLEANPFEKELARTNLEVNHYAEELERLKIQTNPHNKTLHKILEDIHRLSKSVDILASRESELAKEAEALTALNDLTAQLRGVLLENAVQEVENEANRIIEQFFDGLFRIQLQLDHDDLDVTIYRDGQECSYTQLSKGQRQILKLSYSIAVMKKTSSECGIKFPIIMFDEALDGLDSTLKIKALRLFEELSLEYSSVLLIDHSTEIQNLVIRRFHVTINHGNSEVQEIE